MGVMGPPIPVAVEPLPVQTTRDDEELLRSIEHDGVWEHTVDANYGPATPSELLRESDQVQ